MAHQNSRMIAATGMATGLLLVGGAAAVAADEDHRMEKVTICHPDGDGGFEAIAPAEAGAVHGHAAWDFTAHVESDSGHAADIIPPFTYSDKDGDHEFPGQNWDVEGQAIHANDCVVPEQEPPVEEPPAEEPPVEEPPAEEPPVEEPPVEEPPVEEPPVEEPPVEEPPVQEPPVEEPPVQEPPVEEPPVEEPPAEQPPAEQPPAVEPLVAEVPVRGGPQVPSVVQTDGVVTNGSLLTALGVAALLGGGAAVVTVGARAAARRD